MKFPRIKNAMLCQIILMSAMIAGTFLPTVAFIMLIPTLELIGVILMVAWCALAVYLLIRYFPVIFAADVILDTIHCHNTAGKRFPLPYNYSRKKLQKAISKFGKGYEAEPNKPLPDEVRYKFSSPQTVYSSGIEKIVLSYSTDFLDKTGYTEIFRSAEGNVRALTGTKKALFLDKVQKSAPLNRVTVVFIFAKSIDEAFRKGIYETVCKKDGDGFEKSFLPCIIDEEAGFCVFNSIRIPYMGFAYPVKNRGIRIIRNFVFGGRLPLADEDDVVLPAGDIDGMDLENTSLWEFIKKLHYEFVGKEKENKKRFSAMQNGEVILDGEYVFAMWEDRGVCLLAQTDEEKKHITVERIHKWSYPKEHISSKAARIELKVLIEDYFEGIGYSSEFEYFEG